MRYFIFIYLAAAMCQAKEVAGELIHNNTIYSLINS